MAPSTLSRSSFRVKPEVCASAISFALCAIMLACSTVVSHGLVVPSVPPSANVQAQVTAHAHVVEAASATGVFPAFESWEPPTSYLLAREVSDKYSKYFQETKEIDLSSFYSTDTKEAMAADPGVQEAQAKAQAEKEAKAAAAAEAQAAKEAEEKALKEAEAALAAEKKALAADQKAAKAREAEEKAASKASAEEEKAAKKAAEAAAKKAAEEEKAAAKAAAEAEKQVAKLKAEEEKAAKEAAKQAAAKEKA